ELPGVNRVGVAAQEDAIALGKFRDQLAHFGVRPKDIADRLEKEIGIALQLPELMHVLQYLENGKLAALDLVLERTIVKQFVHRLTRQRRMRPDFLQRAAMIEKPDDVAEIENDRLHAVVFTFSPRRRQVIVDGTLRVTDPHAEREVYDPAALVN